MKLLAIFTFFLSATSLAFDNNPQYCEATNLPLTKVVKIDNEWVTVCLVCEHDPELGGWQWAYRNYNCPGVVYPDNG